MSGRRGSLVAVTAVLAVLLTTAASAEIPKKINYQGLLTDAVTKRPLAGSHNMIFMIYDSPSGGTHLWSEAQAVTADSTGLVNVILGTNQPIDVSFVDSTWLQVEVDGQVLSPRRQMVSVPYALNAERVNGLGASTVPTPNTLCPLGPDGKVPPAVLPPGLPPGAHASTHDAGGSDQISVTSDLIVDQTIVTNDLADNSVTLPKIQPVVLSSIDGVANDGGDVDLVAQNTITISGDDASNRVTIGETHSARTDNPHGTTAAQTGAPVSVEGVSNPGGNIDLIPGSNISISADDGANTITISAAGGGDITAVNAGTGLNGGGTSGGVTLNVNVPLELTCPNPPLATIVGMNTSNGYTYGLYGESSQGDGVHGTSTDGNGVYGQTTNGSGVRGSATSGEGAYGSSDTGQGVYGTTANDDYDIAAGVWGEKTIGGGAAVRGNKSGSWGYGIYGTNTGTMGSGVAGSSTNWVGLWGESTNGDAMYARTHRPDHNYGLYSEDNIFANGYTFTGSLMHVVQNGGSETLEPGDVAIFTGAAAPLEEGGPPVIQVGRGATASSTAVAGVVYSRFNIEVVTGLRQSDGKGSVGAMEVTPAGPVAPGDYLLLVVQGPAQVKASAMAGPIHPGDLLFSASEAGYAAGAAQMGLEGVAAAQPGTVLGKALGALSSGKEMIYVFVTLQ